MLVCICVCVLPDDKVSGLFGVRRARVMVDFVDIVSEIRSVTKNSA